MPKTVKKSVREIIRDNRNRQSPLIKKVVLWAHDVRSMHNVGSFFRSADAFGIEELLLSGFTPTPPRPEISKTALGAEEHVRWRYVDSPVSEMEALKSAGYTVIGLEQTHNSESLIKTRLPGERICLLLGNEVLGIDESLIPHVDQFTEIPQFGMKHSLNVSVAAGIALYALLEKYEEAYPNEPL